MVKRNERQLNKPVELSHIKNDLSLVNRKMFNVLLWNAIKVNNLDYEVNTISIDLLLKYTNTPKKQKYDIKKIINDANELCNVKLEWDLLNYAGQRDRGVGRLLGSFRIIDNEYAEYTLVKPIRDKLKEMDIYVKIDLGIVKLMCSKHTIAFYEFVIKFGNIKSTGYIPIDRLRELILGSSDKYKEYKFFKYYVIDKCIRELHNLPEFNKRIIPVSYPQGRRKKTHIKFMIRNKTPEINNIHNYQYRNNTQQMSKEEIEEYTQQQQENVRKIREKLQNKD